MKKSWFKIKAEAAADTDEVTILDYIGQWGVNAQDFLREVKALKAQNLRVVINTPGGSVIEGLAILNGLRALGKNIEVKVLGVAASIGSYIAMAGDKIVMPANTMMFLHNPINAVYGNADDMREMAEVLDKFGDVIKGTYLKRWKDSEAKLDEIMAAETWLTAEQCLEYGLCDEVVDEIKAEAAFDVEDLPEAVRKVFETAAAAADTDPAPAQPGALAVAEVTAAAEAAGVPQFAGIFALDPKLQTLAAVQARAAEAKQIVDLCALLKAEPQAYVAAGKSYGDVRADLTAKRAEQSETTVTDTARSSMSTNPAPSQGFNPIALWGEIRQVQKESYQ